MHEKGLEQASAELDHDTNADDGEEGYGHMVYQDEMEELVELVDWDQMNEMAVEDETAVSCVALEALEGAVDEDQDVTGTEHPVLDPGEEIHMSSPGVAAEEARGDLNSSFVRTTVGSVLKVL